MQDFAVKYESVSTIQMWNTYDDFLQSADPLPNNSTKK